MFSNRSSTIRDGTYPACSCSVSKFLLSPSAMSAVYTKDSKELYKKCNKRDANIACKKLEFSGVRPFFCRGREGGLWFSMGGRSVKKARCRRGNYSSPTGAPFDHAISGPTQATQQKVELSGCGRVPLLFPFTPFFFAFLVRAVWTHVLLNW